MGGKLLCEVVQREERMRVVKAFLVLAVAALDLAVVPWGVRADELVTDAKLGSGLLKKCGVPFLLLEKRFVNSNPLSVCTHSTRMPRRAYQLVSRLRKSAEE